MAQPMNLVAFGNCEEEKVLTPREVYFQIQKYKANLSILQKSLSSSRKLFFIEKTVWPDQCDNIIESFHIAHKHVQTFSRFLDTSAQFTHPISILRYPLVQRLHSLDVQLRDSCTLIRMFQYNSQIHARNAIGQSQEIRSHLENLTQNWRQFQRESRSLMDQIQTLSEAKFKDNIVSFAKAKSTSRRDTEADID